MRVLDRDEARRVAVRAQLLTADRPTNLVALVEHLGLVQVDPVSAVAPSADLVAWSRLGASYRPEDLERALDERAVFEHLAGVAAYLPTRDLPLHLADMRRWPTRPEYRDWLAANPRFRADVLARLRADGPLRVQDLEDTCEVPWSSTGWTNAKNVGRMLEFLVMQGEVAVSRRRGRTRWWDLAERVHPAGLPVVPVEEARAERGARGLRALGLARPQVVGDAGEPVRVEGTQGEWRLDPGAPGGAVRGRAALLSPFDRLVHDRVRAQELFGFTYLLEMYKPRAARRWGYYALPVLHGDRLVGKLDATADRRAGRLVVAALHEDEPWSDGVREAVYAEVVALAEWLGLSPSWPGV